MTNNRAGYYKGNLSKDSYYESFVPSPLPPSPSIEIDNEMLGLLVEANSLISGLERISQAIPDVKLFMAMYVRKEALMSSQIEGTQATLEDILDPTISENANLEVLDVVNYVRAIDYALDNPDNLPICNRFIRNIHKVLLSGVRGQEKNPGEFRRSQNWIGQSGSSLKNATYIPPSPEDMTIAMDDLERYINSNDDLNELIKVSLIHYQFETIHPFLDGNGRIGRLLIILYLMQKNIISSPVMYISYFLKKNRIEYYDRISEVRNKGNYEQWVKFFLRAIIQTCEDAIDTIERINKLTEKDTARIREFDYNKNILVLYNYLLQHPIIDIGMASKNLGLSYNTVSKCISRLSELTIVKQNNNKNRNRLFCYKEYLEILKNGTEL